MFKNLRSVPNLNSLSLKLAHSHLILFNYLKKSFNKVDALKKELKGFSKEFYEEAKKTIPMSDKGIVKLEKEIFDKGVQCANSEADIDYLLTIAADYMGNLNPISGNSLDSFVAKALELGCPEKINPLLLNHRAMLYYPSPDLITEIARFYDKNNKWAELKAFYNSIGRKQYILKSSELYKIFFHHAYANKEYKEIVEAFLDIVDYEETHLDVQSYLYIIYSNSDMFLKDSVYIKFLERSVRVSQVESFGVNLPLLFYYYNKAEEKNLHDILDKISKNPKKSNTVLVFDAAFIKETLTKILTEESEINARIRQILKSFDNSNYDASYAEILNKLN